MDFWKLIKVENDKEITNIRNNNNKCLIKFRAIFYDYLIYILLFINTTTNYYLLIENKKKSEIIKDIIDFKNTFDYNNNSFKNNFPNQDKDMIGLYYPEINFGAIKESLKNYSIIASIIDLINQLEIKLIYLEKEINITKLISFYTSRKYFLKDRNISYYEQNLKELHDIVNWIIIHKSNQLKGIASDKYLACKYVESKLGKNLCLQRIAVYNSFEELNYTELSKYGNFALKISNSCWKTVFFYSNATKDDFYDNMKKLKRLLEYDHGLVDAQFFHLYAKKRIIVEKQFIPLDDLYEFKFFVINNNIKFILLRLYVNNELMKLFYDPNFNFLYKKENIFIEPLNITSMFKKNDLEDLKKYAIKLSEDFPNFVRVDLYLFHNKIYFSELTFASDNGLPLYKDVKFIKEAVSNFSRLDD
jgi:hypothetical protein